MTVPWHRCLLLHVLTVQEPQKLPHLSRHGDVDLLWGHEQDGTHGPSVHFGDRDGENHEPGEQAGQRVDHAQQRVSQQQPHVRANPTLWVEFSVITSCEIFCSLLSKEEILVVRSEGTK